MMKDDTILYTLRIYLGKGVSIVGNERLIIQIPTPLKARLDALRKEGYTASGYIRALVQEDLDERDRLITMGVRPMVRKESGKMAREGRRAKRKGR